MSTMHGYKYISCLKQINQLCTFFQQVDIQALAQYYLGYSKKANPAV